jgi:hypothetical protein
MAILQDCKQAYHATEYFYHSRDHFNFIDEQPFVRCPLQIVAAFLLEGFQSLLRLTHVPASSRLKAPFVGDLPVVRC